MYAACPQGAAVLLAGVYELAGAIVLLFDHACGFFEEPPHDVGTLDVRELIHCAGVFMRPLSQ
jgi:hypothetical protein